MTRFYCAVFARLSFRKEAPLLHPIPVHARNPPTGTLRPAQPPFVCLGGSPRRSVTHRREAWNSCINSVNSIQLFLICLSVVRLSALLLCASAFCIVPVCPYLLLLYALRVGYCLLVVALLCPLYIFIYVVGCCCCFLFVQLLAYASQPT